MSQPTVSITVVGNIIQVSFQPKSEQELKALDTALQFEGLVKSLPLTSHYGNKEGAVVGEIGGHEKARWINIDIGRILTGLSAMLSNAELQLIADTVE